MIEIYSSGLQDIFRLEPSQPYTVCLACDNPGRISIIELSIICFMIERVSAPRLHSATAQTRLMGHYTLVSSPALISRRYCACARWERGGCWRVITAPPKPECWCFACWVFMVYGNNNILYNSASVGEEESWWVSEKSVIVIVISESQSSLLVWLSCLAWHQPTSYQQ